MGSKYCADGGVPMSVDFFMNRRGYFYTVSVLFFAAIFLAVFFAQSDISEPVTAQQERVASMDDFISDLHRDIDRAAFIAGFRSLIALEEHVADSGEYLTNLSANFTEAFTNGSVGGEAYEVLDNSTFQDYITRVQQEAQQFGLRLNITLLNVTLYHISPWQVSVDYAANISVNDSRGTSRWYYTQFFSTQVNLFGLRDPLYSVETNNKLPNSIDRFDNFDEFVDDAGDANDTTVLQAFLSEGYYTASDLAPNFLMRFTGNFSADEFGIESLVNLEDLDAQGEIVSTTRSVVDHVYFTTAGSADWCSVQNMPEYFRLDDEHRIQFEIDELDYSPCP
jgi:hypothetical protein